MSPIFTEYPRIGFKSGRPITVNSSAHWFEQLRFTLKLLTAIIESSIGQKVTFWKYFWDRLEKAYARTTWMDGEGEIERQRERSRHFSCSFAPLSVLTLLSFGQLVSEPLPPSIFSFCYEWDHHDCGEKLFYKFFHFSAVHWLWHWH